MDYGRAKQSGDSFSGAEAGIRFEDIKNIEAKNESKLKDEPESLNSSTFEENTGHGAVKTSESIDSSEKAPLFTPELGKVVELNMPPRTSEDKEMDPNKIIEASFDRTVIKTDDKLNSGAIKEVDAAIVKLNQTGNIADFYDTARDAMEVNLSNSYNRTLDNGKLAA